MDDPFDDFFRRWSSEGGSVKTDVLFSTSLGALSCSPRLTCRQLN